MVWCSFCVKGIRYMNKERYNDPTADRAIANVTREDRRKKKQESDKFGKEPERKSRRST